MTGASCCSLALLARRALAIRSNALTSEPAAEGGVVPEAADMVLTLVIRYADQHYRKIVNMSFSKLAYFAESRTASVQRPLEWISLARMPFEYLHLDRP
jgi:hypothetical protein